PARLVEDLPSCNLVMRRREYLELGGMSEALFTAEDLDFCIRLRAQGRHILKSRSSAVNSDLDFCIRLRAQGRHILYSPDVLVYHKNRNLRGFLNQRLTYGACLGILAVLFRKGLLLDVL